MTQTCQAAVFTRTGAPLEMRTFEVPDSLPPGAALVRVSLATICGSDLHTIHGRRTEPAPLVLGHEIVGRVEALGEGLHRDGDGQPLRVGDRVSWTIMASCGECFFCRHKLPQKCTRLRKYGHHCCEEPPGITGGYSPFVFLWPGTGIFRVPDNLDDRVAAPANCALATVENALEAIGLDPGDTVLIQGAGLLGLNLIALAREAGAARVIVADVSPSRLDWARRFGADLLLNPAETAPEKLVEQVRDLTAGRGADVAFEVCGVNDAVAFAVEALRTGGRYLIAGLVTPGDALPLQGNTLIRKCLTLRGIHNYRPEHLGRGLHFLEANAHKYPYADLVSEIHPLAHIEDAIAAAASGRFVRVGVRPGD